jgi:acetyl esterase/lipase
VLNRKRAFFHPLQPFLFANVKEDMHRLRLLVVLSVSFCLDGAGNAEEKAPIPSPRPVTIWSDGTRMAGDLYVPADLKPGEKRPAILFCAGTGGTKKGNGALYSMEGAS